MIRPIRIFISCVAIGVLAGSLLCTMMEPNDSSSIGGTGSEVVGVVKYPDSTGAAKVKFGALPAFMPVENGSVFINFSNYLADTSKGTEVSATTTGADGFFKISNVLPGEHIVYVRDNGGNAVSATVNVPAESTTIDLGTLVVRKTAGVAIQYNGTAPGDVLFFIDVRGTGLQLRCTSRDLKVTLDKIPTGADVKYTITIRMFKPVVRGYDLPRINLLPDMIETLESITGD
jgi:hypothetical protein